MVVDVMVQKIKEKLRKENDEKIERTCVRWFVSWLILVVNAKEGSYSRLLLQKLCFFTAGTLLFSSDDTLFDRLLYKMFRSQMAFLRNLVNVGNTIPLRTYYQTMIIVIRVTEHLLLICQAFSIIY